MILEWNDLYTRFICWICLCFPTQVKTTFEITFVAFVRTYSGIQFCSDVSFSNKMDFCRVMVRVIKATSVLLLCEGEARYWLSSVLFQMKWQLLLLREGSLLPPPLYKQDVRPIGTTLAWLSYHWRYLVLKSSQYWQFPAILVNYSGSNRNSCMSSSMWSIVARIKRKVSEHHVLQERLTS